MSLLVNKNVGMFEAAQRPSHAVGGFGIGAENFHRGLNRINELKEKRQR